MSVPEEAFSLLENKEITCDNCIKRNFFNKRVKVGCKIHSSHNCLECPNCGCMYSLDVLCKDFGSMINLVTANRGAFPKESWVEDILDSYLIETTRTEAYKKNELDQMKKLR